MTRFQHIFVVALFLSGAALAQSAPSLYKQVAKFEVGGEGGWDYITYDASSNRLFVAHSMEITVLDAASGKKIGSVPANGAHGIALVNEKNLGFSTNGRAGTVTVFDLKTLQPKQEIKAGENPDAIMYDHYSRKVIVMNGRSKDVMVIDPDALKAVATVPLGGKLEAGSSDAAHVYVNIEDTGEIASINSSTWKEDHRWKLPGCEEPSGMAIDEKNIIYLLFAGTRRWWSSMPSMGECWPRWIQEQERTGAASIRDSATRSHRTAAMAP